jgi:hypothetical protein
MKRWYLHDPPLPPHLMEVVCRLGLKMICADIGRTTPARLTSSGPTSPISRVVASVAVRTIYTLLLLYRCLQQRIAAVFLFIAARMNLARFNPQ